MANARGEPRLVQEHADELVLVGEVGVQHLERDQALEPGGALRIGDVHDGHAARGELGQDLVTFELGSNGERTNSCALMNRHELSSLSV